jgi:hypothetical protein
MQAATTTPPLLPRVAVRLRGPILRRGVLGFRLRDLPRVRQDVVELPRERRDLLVRQAQPRQVGDLQHLGAVHRTAVGHGHHSSFCRLA